mgnify:FL=1
MLRGGGHSPYLIVVIGSEAAASRAAATRRVGGVHRARGRTVSLNSRLGGIKDFATPHDLPRSRERVAFANQCPTLEGGDMPVVPRALSAAG